MSTNSSLSSLASLDDLLQILRDKISSLSGYRNYQEMLQNEFWRVRSQIDLSAITAEELFSPLSFQRAISSALKAVQTAMLTDKSVDIRKSETGQLVYGLYTADTGKLLESFANLAIRSADVSLDVTRPTFPVRKEHSPKKSVTRSRHDLSGKVTTLTPAQQLQLTQELRSIYDDTTYQYYPFGQKRCLIEGCELCRQVFCFAPLSSCSLHSGPNCTKLGWYPHLPPQIQALKVKEHRQGSVSLWRPKLLPGQIQNPLPELLFPQSTGTRTPPSYQPFSPEGSPPPSDTNDGSPLRLESRARKRAGSHEPCSSNWAIEIERIEGSKTPRIEDPTSPTLEH